MTPPLLCLLAATGIFRFLSADADKAFRRRLATLLPRSVMKDHLRIMMAEFPARLAEFRLRVLPFSALHVLFNALACVCFMAALWYFPPRGMDEWDLLFVRYGGLLLVPLAFMADVVAFARMLLSTFGREGRADEAA